jgi:sigma-B regulation protein RsbU (phosphoserine phosphatase)
MQGDGPGTALLREDVLAICVGTAFVVIGLAAGVIASVRRRSGGRVLAWLGLWSAMYGIQELGRTAAFVAVLPRVVQAAVPYVNVAASYLVVVVASLVWLELSLGALRRLIRLNVVAGLAIALAGIATFVLTGDRSAFALPNNLLAVVALLALLAVVPLPERLARRYLVLPHRGVLAVGTFLFAGEALFVNLSRPFGYGPPRFLDWLGFATLLFSFGYVALQAVDARERRLLSIENELAVARRLQLSILPATVPEIGRLSIAAVYRPMTAVAGDFYEFLPVDAHRAGFLVADVSGHGVPAALIAAMVKMAVASVAAWADDPGALLQRLGQALHGHLRGQYVTAAYLWLDTRSRTARYAAAGHPPLLRWRAADRTVDQVECNGLLFGVEPDAAYPSCELALAPGDRFLLYTDGLTETESAAGEPFGNARLQEVLREGQSVSAKELSQRLLEAAGAWRPPSAPQQDDITFLVIDCLPAGGAGEDHRRDR